MKIRKAQIYSDLGATMKTCEGPTYNPTNFKISKDKELFKMAYKGLSKYANDTAKYKRITNLDSLKEGTWYYFIAKGTEDSPYEWLANGGFFVLGKDEGNSYYHVDIEDGLENAASTYGGSLFDEQSDVLFCRRANKKEIAAAEKSIVADSFEEYDRLFSRNAKESTEEDIKSPESAVLTSPDDFKDGTWYLITGLINGVEARMLCNGSFSENTGKHHHVDLDTFEVFTSDSKYMPSLMFISGREASRWEKAAAEARVRDFDLNNKAMLAALTVAKGGTSLGDILIDILKEYL